MTNKTFAASSLAAQAMGWIDPVTKAVVPPIHMASTYQRDEDNGYSSGRIYARPDNPTFDQAEATLAALEGGPKALVFSSGMSAATACFLALAPGDHVVAPKVMYWSLRNWLAGFAQQWGLKVDFVDADRTDAIAAAVRPGMTKLVWIETPANPTWCVTDIAAAADIAHRAGALLGVDSTVGTPVLTRPIELGADVVMHSATKYLNGHSDIIAGALVGARDDEYWQKLRDHPRAARHHPRPDRGVAAAARHAHAVPARCLGLPIGRDPRRAPVVPSHGGGGALSRPALLRGARGGEEADEGRLRRHAVGARQGRRARRHRLGGTRRTVEARDVAGRRRKPHRASRQRRRAGHALPDRSAAPVGRRRGRRATFWTTSTRRCAAATTPKPVVRTRSDRTSSPLATVMRSFAGRLRRQGKALAQGIVLVEAKARLAGLMGAAADFDDHRSAAADRRCLAHDAAAEDGAGAALEPAFDRPAALRGGPSAAPCEP